MNVKNTYKNKLFEAYQRFCIANDVCFVKPRKLKVEEFVINIPTEQRIDTIIACCGWVYATVFNLSKHGLRPDEIAKLTLRNIDLEHGKINVPTSKLGAQRTMQLKKQAAEMLKEYVNRKKIQALDKRLFGATCKVKENWRKYRRRAYEKFRDAELLKIRLYDLRHWFATTTYIKTRDIFYVKYALGHRRLENTLIYIHLAKSLTDFPEDYSCATARSVDEASKLIEQGFDYVCECDTVKLFRKRK
jgi:integrase